jgi:hypothetical protein
MPSFAQIVEWFIQPEVSKVFVIGLIIYLLMLWAALIIWATKDIISRTNNIILEIVSIILVVVLNIFGAVIYLAIRPSKTLMEKFFEDLEYEALSVEVKEEPKKQQKNDNSNKQPQKNQQNQNKSKNKK